MKSRFLTKKEKQYWISELDKENNKNKVDKDFIPYLKKINDLDGICTVYCCTGHSNKNNLVGGYLMIRTTKSVHNKIQSQMKKITNVFSHDGLNEMNIMLHQDHDMIIIFRWEYPYFKKAITTIMRHIL